MPRPFARTLLLLACLSLGCSHSRTAGVTGDSDESGERELTAERELSEDGVLAERGQARVEAPASAEAVARLAPSRDPGATAPSTSDVDPTYPTGASDAPEVAESDAPEVAASDAPEEAASDAPEVAESGPEEAESGPVELLSPNSQQALRMAPNPMLLLPARYSAESVVTAGENWGAQSYRDDELTLSIHAVAQSRQLLSPEELARIPPPPDRIRGLPARISMNEQIRTASWEESTVSFSLDIECAQPMNDPRCTRTQFIRELAAQLVLVPRGTP